MTNRDKMIRRMHQRSAAERLAKAVESRKDLDQEAWFKLLVSTAAMEPADRPAWFAEFERAWSR